MCLWHEGSAFVHVDWKCRKSVRTNVNTREFVTFVTINKRSGRSELGADTSPNRALHVPVLIVDRY